MVCGFDGGKKVKGRKRHIVVDSQGLLIGVLVTEANASERLGAVVVLYEAVEKLNTLEVPVVQELSTKTYPTCSPASSKSKSLLKSIQTAISSLVYTIAWVLFKIAGVTVT